jgi:hypothetical protein
MLRIKTSRHTEDFGDGNHVPYEYLWFNSIVPENSGVRIEQWSINENMYNYMKEIQNITTSVQTPFSTPPSNPISNIYNIDNPHETVLGFFEICTATELIYLPKK